MKAILVLPDYKLTYISSSSFFHFLLPIAAHQKYDKAVEDYKAKHPEDPAFLKTADEKLQDAIADAIARQDEENEAALQRMEARTSEFVLEMSEDSITAPDWA